jgi:hypothetical protein
MTSLTLIVIPGPGARTVEIANSATVADLVCQENLHGRDIIINGQGIRPTDWEATTVLANAEVFATGSVKGNAKGGGSKGGGRPANAPSGTGRPSGGGRGNNAPSSK